MQPLPERLYTKVAYRVTTPRLSLRCHEPRDAAAFQAALAANLEHLSPWLCWARTPPTLDEQLARTVSVRAGFDLGRDFIYGLFDREHGQVLGSVGLHPRIGPGGLEIGYWIDQNHEGRGLVSEAVGALARVALELMQAEYVEIRHEPANERSGRVPERLGFTRDGLLRRRCVFGGGERRDAVVWSLFRDELAGTPVGRAEFEAFDALGRPIY